MMIAEIANQTTQTVTQTGIGHCTLCVRTLNALNSLGSLLPNQKSKIKNQKCISACFLLLSLLSGVAWSEESLTPAQFKKIVATPGDTKPLRPELAALPFWRNAICSVTLKYEEGRLVKEDCLQTAKTVAGKYIVFTTDSQLYKQPMHCIVGYDQRASAIKQWGLYKDTVTEATMVFDPEKKVTASTSAYGGGFMELSITSASDNEMSGHARVYKNGVLFLTREVKTRPIKTESALDSRH
jgi:hypothetical protein